MGLRGFPGTGAPLSPYCSVACLSVSGAAFEPVLRLDVPAPALSCSIMGPQPDASSWFWKF